MIYEDEAVVDDRERNKAGNVCIT